MHKLTFPSTKSGFLTPVGMEVRVKPALGQGLQMIGMLHPIGIEDLLPLGSKYEEEDLINFLVVDLGTGRVIGCSEKCGELYGIYPEQFRVIQDFQLLAQQLFKDFDKIVSECNTQRFKTGQQFVKLEKKVPEILTQIDTSFLKEVFIQAKN